MTNLIEQRKLNKRTFNLNDADDLKEFNYFLENKRWKNICPFHVSWPYTNVVDMIKDQIVRQYLNSFGKDGKKYNFTELEKAMR